MSHFKSLFSCIAVLCISSSSFAAIECIQNKSVRKIEVVYSGAEGKAPCAVQYTKEDNSKKEIAAAKADGAVCEQKAKSLADKLTGFGWKCEEK